MSITVVSPTTADSKGAQSKDDASVHSEDVPKTMTDALRVFFLGGYVGPPVVAVILGYVAVWRYELMPIGLVDVVVTATAIVFWWLQEIIVHKHLLHSERDWIGKQIHQEHHDKDYFHVSIDDAPLVLGWLATVHVALRLLLPLPLALSATLGYAGAGLFYEWAHYIVHTKVRFRTNSYWQRVKNHHVRHHMKDNNYWFGFSVPAIDTLFGTNPNVKEIMRLKHIKRQASRNI
jgi:hypothetical protein